MPKLVILTTLLILGTVATATADGPELTTEAQKTSTLSASQSAAA